MTNLEKLRLLGSKLTTDIKKAKKDFRATEKLLRKLNVPPYGQKFVYGILHWNGTHLMVDQMDEDGECLGAVFVNDAGFSVRLEAYITLDEFVGAILARDFST